LLIRAGSKRRMRCAAPFCEWLECHRAHIPADSSVRAKPIVEWNHGRAPDPERARAVIDLCFLTGSRLNHRASSSTRVFKFAADKRDDKTKSLGSANALISPWASRRTLDTDATGPASRKFEDLTRLSAWGPEVPFGLHGLKRPNWHHACLVKNVYRSQCPKLL